MSSNPGITGVETLKRQYGCSS